MSDAEFRLACTHSQCDESNLGQADPLGSQNCDNGIFGLYRHALKVVLNRTIERRVAEDVRLDEGC